MTGEMAGFNTGTGGREGEGGREREGGRQREERDDIERAPLAIFPSLLELPQCQARPIPGGFHK